MAHSPTVPGIGVGTWAWGNQFLWGYNPSQDADLRATFAAALRLGLTFFDTADSYGTGRWNGRSESLLGGCIAELDPADRLRLCIATKLAPFPWRLGRHGYDRAFAASRRRLGGKLDRVQLHWSTARYAPWQQGPLLDGLADLVATGQVAELGVSNVGPLGLAQLHQRLASRGVVLSSLQVQLSLLAPQPVLPGGVAQVCRDMGIELIAYSPLGLGVLAGSLATVPKGPRGALFRRIVPHLAPLRSLMEEIGRPYGAAIAAVALNWCRAHGAMPIPGLRRVEQVESAAAALEWQLSEAERLALDRLAFALPPQALMPANPFQSA